MTNSMDRNSANVKHSYIWAMCFTVIAIGCSLIWGNVMMHDSDNKVNIVKVQASK